jgi:hypothetical protein
MLLLARTVAPGTLALLALAGAAYSATVAAVSLFAVAARTPERRRDARQVLAILLPRRPRGGR